MQYDIKHNPQNIVGGTRIDFEIAVSYSPAELPFIRDWFADFQKKFATATFENVHPNQSIIYYSPEVCPATDPTFPGIYQTLISDIETQAHLLADQLLMKKDWITSQDKILELSAQLDELTTLLKLLLPKCPKLKAYRKEFFQEKS